MRNMLFMHQLPLISGKISANRDKKIKNDRGSVLVLIIISIVIVASVGTAMFNSTSSNLYTQIGSVDSLNGYFLAEAGRFYALTYIFDDIEEPRAVDDPGGSFTLLHNKPFSLPDDHGSFKLELEDISVGEKCKNAIKDDGCIIELTSYGIPNTKTDRKISYTIKE